MKKIAGAQRAQGPFEERHGVMSRAIQTLSRAATGRAKAPLVALTVLCMLLMPVGVLFAGEQPAVLNNTTLVDQTSPPAAAEMAQVGTESPPVALNTGPALANNFNSPNCNSAVPDKPDEAAARIAPNTGSAKMLGAETYTYDTGTPTAHKAPDETPNLLGNKPDEKSAAVGRTPTAEPAEVEPMTPLVSTETLPLADGAALPYILGQTSTTTTTFSFGANSARGTPSATWTTAWCAPTFTNNSNVPINVDWS